MRMIHNVQWRWGVGIGLLCVLWIVGYPFLGQAGLVTRLSAANIGGDLLFFGTFLLIEVLLVVFTFVEETRPLSFGMAVPLLLFQIWMMVQTFTSSRNFLAALIANLPGCTVLLIVGIVYYRERVRYSREQSNRFPRS